MGQVIAHFPAVCSHSVNVLCAPPAHWRPAPSSNLGLVSCILTNDSKGMHCKQCEGGLHVILPRASITVYDTMLLSCHSNDLVVWACRVLVPILQSGRYWELLVITPRFLLSSPGWLAGATYLAALSTGALPGLALLLTSELRLILRGQTYIESLQVG